MDSPPEPSLLDYARYHGIATDFTAIDHRLFLDLSEDATERHPPQLPVYSDGLDELDRALHKDKLDIRKDTIRFLSSILRETRSDQTDINWAEILPPFNSAHDLKLDLPLFRISAPIELPNSPLRYDEDHDIKELIESVANDLSTVDMDTLTHSLDYGERTVEQVKQERLNCPTSAVLLLQDVTRCNPVPLQESLMAQRPPPLILSPANNLDNEPCHDNLSSNQASPNQEDLSRIACATLTEMGVGPNSTPDDSSVVMSIYPPPSTAEPTVGTSPLETRLMIPHRPKRAIEDSPGGSYETRAEKRPARLTATLGSLSTFLESRGRHSLTK